MKKKWRFLPYRQNSAFANMAIDEAIYRENQRLPAAVPTLRFFGWSPAAISIGYFQNFEQDINVEACSAAGIDVVRRITGGKAVFHASDLTYSISGREEDPLFPPGILGRYLAISRCIAEGIAHFGVQTEMKMDSRAESAVGLEAFCFSVPSHYELLARGRKICGSAQARANGAFLQHGSLLLDFDPALSCRLMSPQEAEGGRRWNERGAESLTEKVTCLKWESAREATLEEICGAIKASIEKCFDVVLEERGLTLPEEALKRDLIANKYETGAWNKKGKIAQ